MCFGLVAQFDYVCLSLLSAEVELTFRIKIRDYLLYCIQTVLYCSVNDATDFV